MSQVSISNSDKDKFDELKPEDMTQAEFTHELILSYEQNGEAIDPDEWAEQVADALEKPLASKTEIAAYRGVSDAIESTEIHE